jgi:carbohydrate kinase (thermoresistant glucokinase family)
VENSVSPLVIIVMGVSGSGKSTIAAALARRRGCQFVEGDRFHPPANVAKMHAGTPLTDEDRWPWLRAIAAFIDNSRAAHCRAVISCSALKRQYRDVLIGDRPDVALIYLKGSPELIARRLASRQAHFMPASLLESQFATLEEPQLEERPITVLIEPSPQEILDRILKRLTP